MLESLEDQIARLAIDLGRPSRPRRIRRLGGGVLTTMHAFDLGRGPDRLALVLRRYRPGPDWRDVLAGLLRTLAVLEAEGIPAPRPVWSDLDGAMFGVPAVVLTRFRGAPIGEPVDPSRWAAQLGQALARIHAVPVAKYDLSYLPPPLEVAHAFLERASSPSAHVVANPFAVRVIDELGRLGRELELSPAVFAHGDFWPGQSIWWRGRLQGVVDWDFPRLDDPGIDVGYCRMDIALLTGPAVSDMFLRAYEEATGASLRNRRFWDLIAAFQALERPGGWHRQGFAGLGRPDLHGGLVANKLRLFVEHA